MRERGAFSRRTMNTLKRRGTVSRPRTPLRRSVVAQLAAIDVRTPFWLSENGKSVTAKGADPDTLVASANAYLGALNKLMVKRQRGKPEAMVVPVGELARDLHALSISAWPGRGRPFR